MKTWNMPTKISLTLLLLGGLLFTSCKKESSSSAKEEAEVMESTASDSEADMTYDEVFNTTMGIGAEANGEELGITAGTGVFARIENGQITGRVDSTQRCFTVTVTPMDRGVFPKTVVINFGNGCLGRDGKLRKGKIITVYTGPMRVPGSKATTTFDGFKVDSVAVEGTHQVENNSTSSNLSFTTRVINGKLTWDSGRWVKWTTTRTVTQVEGNGTPFYPLDDIFTITGAGRGENSRGASWAHEIIEPL
ncbi:MAG: hypothetical protein KGZ74_02230, partial [Chitinophagaceae bacterium]|nr:hypothetical protein [Chitinophagaceae bacterium]